jgi:hypothetical protein
MVTCCRSAIPSAASRRDSSLLSASVTSDGTELETALREQHVSQEPTQTRTDEHGRYYTIRAILIGPRGAAASVVSIWCIRTGEELPRFVTAYPGRTT